MSEIAFQIRVKSAAVNFIGHPMLMRGLFVLCKIIWKVSDRTIVPVITSMWDQKHGRNSLHYIGCAVDVRSHYLTEDQKEEVLREFARRMEDDYDLLLHPRGEPTEHFHLEWDTGKLDRDASIRAALGIR